MPPNRKAMTVRERQLSDELQRIRSTYSFQLGLLLTETFARKPWKIPLFPFSFIALNFQFLKQRKQRKPRERREDANDLDFGCLLLYTTTEEGTASVERCGILAKDWLLEQGRKVVVVSSNREVRRYLPSEAIVYPINDPKKLRENQRGNWNAQCENLLTNILETHHPTHAVFDGPYPYRGIINTAEHYDNTTWTWLRPQGVLNDALKARATGFSSIARFELGKTDDVQWLNRIKATDNPNIKPVVLNALGYGTQDDIRGSYDPSGKIPSTLQLVDHVTFCKQADGVEPLLDNKELKHLTAALVPVNIELIANMVMANVPTICIFDEHSSRETLSMLRKHCVREPVMFCSQNDEVQLAVALEKVTTLHEQMRRVMYGYERRNIVEQLFTIEPLHTN
mgnify:CR=1 FL=1